MGLIPEEIKAVERPDKTEVRLYGGKYRVVPYISLWNAEAKKPYKKSLPYIGSIEEVDGKYVYVEDKDRDLHDRPGVKIYGDFQFVNNLGLDLKDDLIDFYGREKGIRIFVYTLLRILYGNQYAAFQDNYIHSYISEVYPDIPMSKNTVSDFTQSLGEYDNHNKEFLIQRLKDHRILIFDGTTIVNDGNNPFSEYGRKYKQTKRKQICKMKVYDVTNREPVYSEVIPGNVIDKQAFIAVLSKFNLENTIIIIDKGFNSKANIEYLIENNIKFIMPMNDNSKDLQTILEQNKFSETFKFNEKVIKCFKTSYNDSMLYCYKDPFISAKQESNYLSNINRNKEGYTFENIEKKEPLFGVIAFCSNCDFKTEEPYKYYKERWIIEENIRIEKSSLNEGVERKHNLKSILGNEFFIQLEMIIYSRILHVIEGNPHLKGMSIRGLLNELAKTYKTFSFGKWIISIMTKKKIALLAELNVPIA